MGNVRVWQVGTWPAREEESPSYEGQPNKEERGMEHTELTFVICSIKIITCMHLQNYKVVQIPLILYPMIEYVLDLKREDQIGKKKIDKTKKTPLREVSGRGQKITGDLGRGQLKGSQGKTTERGLGEETEDTQRTIGDLGRGRQQSVDGRPCSCFGGLVGTYLVFRFQY